MVRPCLDARVRRGALSSAPGQASYLSAVSVLLYFTPSLRHVFQATPRQVVLAALALYTIELGVRRLWALVTAAVF